MKLSYYELDEHLATGELEPVYVLTGEQDLLRDLAAEAIQYAVVGDSPTPFNCERLDGTSLKGEEVVDAANIMPLLGGRRVVVVRRASKLAEKSERLLDYVRDPSPATVLVLVLEKRPDGRKKAFKDLSKDAAIVTCDAPKNAVELEDWISDQAQMRGLKLGRDAIRYLALEFGSDMRRLGNELEKLSLYASGDKLDLETMTTLLGRGKAQHIFKFVESLESGDSASALRQLDRLLTEGEPPLRILALIDRLVGQLRVAHAASSSGQGRGSGGAGLASVLGVPPFVAKRLASNARRRSERDLKNAVESVADADRLLKSTSFPDRVILETLVMALGRGSQASVATRRLRRDL